MAGGPEDHFTDSRELYVLVEGDEWAHVEEVFGWCSVGTGFLHRLLANPQARALSRMTAGSP
jgi:hypothetical protein